MNTLDETMKTFLAKQLPIQATVSKDGLPDIGPKRSLRVFDDRTLIYNENTGGQTLQNIRDGSKMAIAVIDREALDGYRFVGRPEIFCDGGPYDTALAFAETAGMKPPKCAVLVHIEEIYTLRSGPTAGKKLDEMPGAV
ncbi:pyridoxamine 5'-phosphate oxidase family protein [Brucella intermedia]|uniref:pyridoxamine 5'-phosphate oxidase family protein n=1 Tax=Brucella intermedia TaxID=94625 RepID=UPI00224AE5DF|nr:pyridoxamine 5'-phosphate oxidase family protein [Brucella intermedia]